MPIVLDDVLVHFDTRARLPCICSQGSRNARRCSASPSRICHAGTRGDPRAAPRRYTRCETRDRRAGEDDSRRGVRAGRQRSSAGSRRRSAASYHAPPSEVRRGVQALSRLYVERRGAGRLARALDGAAKRAALATYYAPLHFLAAWPAALLAARSRRRCRRRAGRSCAVRAVRVCMISARHAPWALRGARARERVWHSRRCTRHLWASARARTCRAFGLPHRERRGTLPGARCLAPSRRLLVLSFVVNELDAPAHDIDRR